MKVYGPSIGIRQIINVKNQYDMNISNEKTNTKRY
jgi:hypothetical protein